MKIKQIYYYFFFTNLLVANCFQFSSILIERDFEQFNNLKNVSSYNSHLGVVDKKYNLINYKINKYSIFLFIIFKYSINQKIEYINPKQPKKYIKLKNQKWRQKYMSKKI